MALLNRMDQGTDLYVLDLTNDQSESTLDADSPSSASNFNILLSPTLDLSSLLYLRSVAAEITLAQLTVDALPLTATKRESITVRVDIPHTVILPYKSLSFSSPGAAGAAGAAGALREQGFS